MNKPSILTAPLLIILLTISCTGTPKETAFLPCNQLANTPVRKVFEFTDKGVGIVLENEIRFFYTTGYREHAKTDENITFTLPPNVKDVFQMLLAYYLGVVFEDKIVFYEKPHNSVWQEKTDMAAFNLPKNCQGAFNFYGGLGIIADNKITFYAYDKNKNTWEEAQFKQCTLPKNTQGVFEYSGVFTYQGKFELHNYLGIINENKISFLYADNDNNWIEAPNILFYFSENIKGAYYSWLGWLGIVTDNKIAAYQWNENEGWVNYAPATFDFIRLEQ